MPSNTVAPITKDQVFSRVPKNDSVVYSTFDRSFRHLSAFDAGYLIPLFVDEVYPGDIYQLTGRHLNRLLASVHPFMDNLTFYAHFFYCPTRLIWDKFRAFMGERRRPEESITDQYQVPMLNSGEKGVGIGTIFDYAGIPTGVPNLEFSALPFRAMNLCYNEWYRDENLCDWLNVGGLGDAESEFGESDQLSNYNLFKRAKAHDYFTSALPFQQKGEAMSISIGNTAPVHSPSGPEAVDWLKASTGKTSTYPFISLISGTSHYDLNCDFGSGTTNYSSFRPNLIADLQNVTGFTISDFRTAMQLQALKELNARSGTRYKEIINGEWNVTISDATLDRPEFLGSYNIPFNIVTVASTAETADNPQGNLSAYGITSNEAFHGFTKAFEEHGYVIGFVGVRTEQSYQQGLNRMWSRKNRYDFYTPMLANLSEQAIKMKEILAQGASVLTESGTPVDDETFGYQEAWAELRYKPNMVTGKMRSSDPQSLDVWHLASEFAPTIDNGQNLGIPLNQDFIDDNTDKNLERVLAVKDEPQILSDNYFKLKCTRELPIYSVPAYLFGGRF
ncbi:major capsid protein [Dipodfec virus UOA04_Rod_771]|nr:major capsid protein [Dipodfec virus UOA04_Rod_771]